MIVDSSRDFKGGVDDKVTRKAEGTEIDSHTESAI
jgi:hypothetical protein